MEACKINRCYFSGDLLHLLCLPRRPPRLLFLPLRPLSVDANKELVGKLKAQKEALLGENTRLIARQRESEDELAEVRNHLRDAQYDLEEASRRAYRSLIYFLA